MKYKIIDIHEYSSWYGEKEWHIGEVFDVDIIKEREGGWVYAEGKLVSPPRGRIAKRVFYQVKLQELK